MMNVSFIALLQLLVMSIITVLSQDYKQYPSSSLQCFSTLTVPDMKLICPMDRNMYCVKETSDLRQNLCGFTKYFGDIFVDSICQYKKCAAECTEGPVPFEYEGAVYTRNIYCCNDKDYCNSSSHLFSCNNLTTFVSTVFLMSVFFIF